MNTLLYQVDKADDQIIGSIVGMLDDFGFEFEHTSTRNYVEARFDFDLADEESEEGNSFYSQISQRDFSFAIVKWISSSSRVMSPLIG